MYAGLVFDLALDYPIFAIKEDYDFWQSDMCAAKAGKLFLVDSGENPDDVIQIYFDGSATDGTLCVQEVVGDTVYEDIGDPRFADMCSSASVVQVDAFSALTNQQYFIECVETAIRQAKDSANLKKTLADKVTGDVDAEEHVSASENAKDYLVRAVYPALFPALEQVK